MNDIITTTVIVATIASGIRLATPFLLAALGEALSQRSGVLNLGVDGVMLLGAFGAYFVVLETENLWAGVLMGMGVGVILGIFYAFVTVVMKAEQGVSGIGIYLFGLGMSDLLFQKLVGTPLPIDQFGTYDIPMLADLPIVGEMFFQHTPMVYIAFLLVPVFAVVMNRTTFGLNVRAVGESPDAADSLGVNVGLVRFATIIIGNMMAGLAGAALALELGISNAMGFIAIALVYFGAWRAPGVMAGALVFGMVGAIVLQGKTLGLIPREASDIATILALVVVANRFRQPAALTKPYIRGH